jgi:hypothetical protein
MTTTSMVLYNVSYSGIFKGAELETATRDIRATPWLGRPKHQQQNKSNLRSMRRLVKVRMRPNLRVGRGMNRDDFMPTFWGAPFSEDNATFAF